MSLHHYIQIIEAPVIHTMFSIIFLFSWNKQSMFHGFGH